MQTLTCAFTLYEHFLWVCFAEYANVQATISNILARCSQVQQRLGCTSSTLPGNSRAHSPTYISRRSKILFEAPQSPGQLVDAASNDITPSGSNPGMSCEPGSPAALLQTQSGQVAIESWAGAVDLNPGFSFQPGSSAI